MSIVLSTDDEYMLQVLSQMEIGHQRYSHSQYDRKPKIVVTDRRRCSDDAAAMIADEAGDFLAEAPNIETAKQLVKLLNAVPRLHKLVLEAIENRAYEQRQWEAEVQHNQELQAKVAELEGQLDSVQHQLDEVVLDRDGWQAYASSQDAKVEQLERQLLERRALQDLIDELQALRAQPAQAAAEPAATVEVLDAPAWDPYLMFSATGRVTIVPRTDPEHGHELHLTVYPNPKPGVEYEPALALFRGDDISELTNILLRICSDMGYWVKIPGGLEPLVEVGQNGETLQQLWDALPRDSELRNGRVIDMEPRPNWWPNLKAMRKRRAEGTMHLDPGVRLAFFFFEALCREQGKTGLESLTGNLYDLDQGVRETWVAAARTAIEKMDALDAETAPRVDPMYPPEVWSPWPHIPVFAYGMFTEMEKRVEKYGDWEACKAVLAKEPCPRSRFELLGEDLGTHLHRALIAYARGASGDSRRHLASLSNFAWMMDYVCLLEIERGKEASYLVD